MVPGSIHKQELASFCSRVPESNKLNAGAYGRGGGVGRGLGNGVDLGSTVAVADVVAVGLAVAVAVAVGEAHSSIANLFRCYFAILITGADAVLVADAARPCVVQP